VSKIQTRRAFHFLREDMTAGNGNEPAWTVGETRTIKGGRIEPCIRGYHASPTARDAITYTPGPMLCLVELKGQSIYKHGDPVDKLVARTRTLVSVKDVSVELRLFAADCAEHILPLFERDNPSDLRPRFAIEAARKFALGEITKEELAAALAAARDAALAAARDAALAAARDAAWTAAWTAALAAAWTAARVAALAAAKDAALAAARDAALAAARDAAWAAAWAAARAAEYKWQTDRAEFYFGTPS